MIPRVFVTATALKLSRMARSVVRGGLTLALLGSAALTISVDVAAAQTSNPLNPSDLAGQSATGGQRSETLPNNPGGPSEQLGSTPVQRATIDDALVAADRRNADTPPPAPVKPVQSEFEQFVTRTLGRSLPRYGEALLTQGATSFALPASAAIPPDYVLDVGDTVAIGLVGSVEGTVQREIDRNGQIFLPRVGAVKLAGIQYRDLRDTISRAIGLQYKGFDVSVSVRELRGVRIYVTGFANRPGQYTVNSLATLVDAVLAAGGPSSGGSFRSVQLIRRGEVIANLDLYQLLRRGDRSGDKVLQSQDIIYVSAVGVQVAVSGSVNEEAIYEIKAGETVQDALALAGGLNVLADPSRAVIYRAAVLESNGPIVVPQTAFAATPLLRGDIIQAVSQGSLIKPTSRQPVLVRIEGEVERPGVYYLPTSSSMADVLALAGGITSRAYPFGTRVERERVRAEQQVGFDDALRQLEVTLASAPLTSDGLSDPARDAAALAGARQLLDRLREAKPDGRIVVDIPSSATVLPGDLVLENNDRIFVPARSAVVGVYGAVYRPASFLISDASPLRVRDYLARAGGTIRAADRGDIFVVRANGAVISRRNGALDKQVLPGDVIFVPVKTRQGGFLSKLRDISSVVFQLGLGVAAFIAVTR